MKEVVVQVPEGYEIDEKESTLDRIILKKKTSKYPTTWEEFCKRSPIEEEYFIATGSTIGKAGYPYHHSRSDVDQNLCRTREEAEAFLALIKLKRLWHEYVDGHKDEYYDYGIYLVAGGWIVDLDSEYSLFSFPSEDLAQEFLNNFTDLFIKIELLYKERY